MNDTPQPIELDLTKSTEEGFKLTFRTTGQYLVGLSQQLEENGIDGMYSIVFQFDDAHPVAARVEHYLSGADYDSIGEGAIGPDDPYETEDCVPLHIYCTRNQLRRFALFNRTYPEAPITFTATMTPENAKSFIRTVRLRELD